MTHEEAIHILRDSKPSTIMKEGEVFERVANVCIAIEMAIESLKHIPCYLDSPCEYQNPDIKIPHTDCIVWHPYPKEKPSDGFDNHYLVTRGYGENYYVDIGWLDEFGWHESNIEANHIYGVTAWAELPKPYEEGADAPHDAQN